MSKREQFALGFVLVALAIFWNWPFVNWVSLPKMLAMNDVQSIIDGYHKVPQPLTHSVDWWHGTWIQKDIHALRPLAAYLFWFETWLGLHHGFFWVGCIGMVLLVLNASLSAALAWRLTRSKAATFLAGILGVALRFHNWSGSTPDYWLAWYPIHQELLMNAFLMGAAVAFDTWVEEGKKKYLAMTWVLFLVGAFLKEHVYIFPAFAFVLALRLRPTRQVGRKQALLQGVLMLGLVAVIWVYRAHVIINPRNPELKWVHIKKKPWMYLFFPLYGYMLTAQFWFPGFALLLFSLAGFIIRWNRGPKRELLHRPYMGVWVSLGCLAIVAVYCQLFYTSFFEMFWYLFDTSNEMIRGQILVILLATVYTVWLLFKYRKTHPTGATFGLMALSYLPVITYLGWHYTVPAWFVRCAYWALVAQLVWADVWPHVEKWLPQRSQVMISRWEAKLKTLEAVGGEA